jgi:hypothetical protein
MSILDFLFEGTTITDRTLLTLSDSLSKTKALGQLLLSFGGCKAVTDISRLSLALSNLGELQMILIFSKDTLATDSSLDALAKVLAGLPPLKQQYYKRISTRYGKSQRRVYLYNSCSEEANKKATNILKDVNGGVYGLYQVLLSSSTIGDYFKKWVFSFLLKSKFPNKKKKRNVTA